MNCILTGRLCLHCLLILVRCLEVMHLIVKMGREQGLVVVLVAVLEVIQLQLGQLIVVA